MTDGNTSDVHENGGGMSFGALGMTFVVLPPHTI